MNWNKFTKLTWKRLIFSFLVILLAASLRIWPLGILETKVVWVTFYPAVMLVALYGGIIAGIIATLLTCIIVLYFWHLLVAAPFIQTNADLLSMGVFFFTCTMISIISERMRQSNKQAKESEEKAKAANEAKGAFLANMSHELRTPLNAILGYSRLMQRDSMLSEENVKNLDIINKSGEHLLSLINDILEITKIESRNSTLNLVQFDFYEMVKEIDDMLRLRTEAKELKFTISGIHRIPRYLIGDVLKLRMVLINLIGNAVKFTNKGSISLSFDCLSQNEQDFRLYVEIQDSGTGISDDEIDKLFIFFSQTESGIKSQVGTGLGLAISQEYVKLMGGKIAVTSKIDTGSRFYFDILLKMASENDLKIETQSKIIIGLKGNKLSPKILVVEDNKDSRELLVKLLKYSNFDVISAEDGKEAVEKYKEYQPDFIWMDIRMPVMDGLEATRHIKALDEGKTKIVAFSAHVFDQERAAILASGFDDFLGKPFSENAIFDLMAKHLNLEYVYKDCADSKEESIQDLQVYIDEILKLDIEKKKALLDAIIFLDDNKILESIRSIEPKAPMLAMYLQQEALKMNYTKILRLVEGGMK